MKAMYKCRLCGAVNVVPIFRLNEHDTEVLESGGWVSADLASVKDAMNYYESILTKCDSDHYGLMDFVGFMEEKSEELKESSYEIVSVGTENTRVIYLLKRTKDSLISSSPLNEYKNFCLVAEYTNSGKFIPHNYEKVDFSAKSEYHMKFADDNSAIKWFLYKVSDIKKLWE